MSRKATWLGRLYGIIKLKLRRFFELDGAAFPRGDGCWSEIDAQNLKSFLAGTTGLRLNAKLRNMESLSAIKGAQDQFHTVHSAGVTNGITSTLDYFYSLTYTFDKAPATQTERQESADQKAERELLERIGAL